MRSSGVAYTLTTPDGTINLNSDWDATDAYYLADAIDFEQNLRVGWIPRPQDSGSIMTGVLADGMQLGFSVVVKTSTAANRTTYEDQLIQYLMSAMDTDASISWTPDDGTSDTRVIRNLRLSGRPVVTGRWGLAKVFSFEMVSTRATAESNTETSTDSSSLDATGSGLVLPFTFPISFTPSGGGLVTAPNAGNAVSYPVLQIHGAVTNPRVKKNGTTGVISLTTTVANGDYLEVDLFNKTVKLNGGTSVPNVLDSANTVWFGIEVGGSALTLSGSNVDGSAKLTTKTRDAYYA